MSTPADHRRGLAFRWSALIASIVLVGLGIALMVSAHFGTAPADVIATGGAARLDIGVGTMGWCTAGVMAVLAVLLRRPPQWGTVIGAFGVGQSVNWFLEILPEPGQVGIRVAMLVAAFTAIYAAVSVGVATNLGTGPIELVMLGLHDRGLPMQASRWGLEAVLLATGILLGGQFGVATVLFVLLTGPVLSRTIPPTARFMGTSAATLTNE